MAPLTFDLDTRRCDTLASEEVTNAFCTVVGERIVDAVVPRIVRVPYDEQVRLAVFGQVSSELTERRLRSSAEELVAKRIPLSKVTRIA